MTVLAPAANDLFRITVRKSHTNNPDRQWENNYEVRCIDTATNTQLNNLGLKVVAFEKAIHYESTQFRLLRISTWEEDSTPYNPESFISLPLTGFGELDEASEDLEPINICWDVARVPISGRFGHLFYRGALVESDVEAPSGRATLADISAMGTRITTELGSSGLGEYMDGTDTQFEIVMINKTGTQVRQVLGLAPRGVAVVPFDHAWFNRTVTP
jgi:hypothetical protein